MSRVAMAPQGDGGGQGSHGGTSLTSDAGVVGDAHDAVGVVRRRCHLPRAASAVPARRNPYQLMAKAKDPTSHAPPSTQNQPQGWSRGGILPKTHTK